MDVTHLNKNLTLTRPITGYSWGRYEKAFSKRFYQSELDLLLRNQPHDGMRILKFKRKPARYKLYIRDGEKEILTGGREQGSTISSSS